MTFFGAALLAAVLGADAAACAADGGPAILATVSGLKDAKGNVRLELYPPNETDFLARDVVLQSQGKLFRRVTAATPPGGRAALCIRVPRPGRYALLFTHARGGKLKFSIWSDGAGFASNVRLGRARPKVSQAIVDAGAGVTTVNIRAQYLRGLSGFGPLEP